eukprot:m.130772 g.130772  ORF g.130772 m.130772 type:complete len:387 (-) comp15730_c0_seq4:19-1179(-)
MSGSAREGRRGDGDPFRSSPFYADVFARPDPFLLPRYEDGSLADFGRSPHILTNVSADRFPSIERAFLVDENDNRYAAAAAGLTVNQQTLASLLSPGSDHLAATKHLHLSFPANDSAVHLVKNPTDYRLSFLYPLQQSANSHITAVMQAIAPASLLSWRHDFGLPDPCACIVAHHNRRGRGFIHFHHHLQSGNTDVWGRAILRVGAVQLGVDARGSTNGPITDFNARVVYAGTRRNKMTGQPESYQVSLSSYRFGTAGELGLYHHTAVRVNALPQCYWRNTSYALLLNYDTQNSQRPWEVRIGSALQLDGTTLVQGVLSDRGTVDVALTSRPYHFNLNALQYLPDVLVTIALSCNLVQSKLAFSASVSFGNWRSWRNSQHLLSSIN